MANYTQQVAEWNDALREAMGALDDRAWELREAKQQANEVRDCAVDAGLWDDTAIQIADREVGYAVRALQAADDWQRSIREKGPAGYWQSVLRIREAMAASAIA